MLSRMRKVSKGCFHQGMVTFILSYIKANMIAVVEHQRRLNAYKSTLMIVAASLRQKHSASLPKNHHLPSTIRQNTSVVEHVLYVVNSRSD
jgi:hypothetical protein